MRANKNIVVIVVLAVFTCSLYANWPAMQPEEERNDVSRTMAKFGEFLLLPYINESDYNSKEAKLSEYGDLIGIGEFAKIATPVTRNHESSTTGQAWFKLYVCGPDLSVFLVSISKPKSLSVACDLIIQRTSQGISKPIPEFCKPKLENGKYSLIINTEAYTGLTRLSIERGLLIGVDFRSILQPLGAPVNREAVLGQMNALIDDLIALVDGDIKMTDEKEEYYKNLKAAYKSAVPDPVIVEERPGPSIWGDD